MKKLIQILTLIILLSMVSTVHSYADDFNVLLEKIRSSYEAGIYQETKEYLSKIMEIIQAKIGEPDHTKLHDAGNGFYYSNLSLERDPYVGDFMYFIGEITNKTGKFYSTAQFTMSVYDTSGKLLAVEDFYVKNVQNDDTVSFDGSFLDKGKIRGQFEIKIKFSSGI